MSKRRSADTVANSPDESASEFRAAVRDVKPLQHTPRAIGPHGAAPRANAPRTGRPAKAHAPRRGAERFDAPQPVEVMPDEVMPVEEPVEAADVLSFRRPGVRDRELRRLRRGLYPVADELDLHGLDQASARSYLASFIESSRDSGHRCVRIIHGKGYRSGARGPVLKTAVNGWLRRHFDVLAFTSARTIDGGTGAVYVLLRV